MSARSRPRGRVAHGRPARRAALVVLVTLTGLAAGCGPVTTQRADAPAPEPVLVRPSLVPDKAAPPAPDPLHGQGPTAAERAQVDDPASDLVVVNKQRPLHPLDFVPDTVAIGGGYHLRPEAATALAALEAAARAAGVGMHPSSAYRSYVQQVTTYQGWEHQLGDESADALSARPGYSEHQTGLAVDMRPETGTCRAYSSCFGATPQAAWLAQHAVEFGFIVRYEAGQSAVTGYEAEPWHLRYVGVEVAARYAASGAHSLEAYFGLPAAPTYGVG